MQHSTPHRSHGTDDQRNPVRMVLRLTRPTRFHQADAALPSYHDTMVGAGTGNVLGSGDPMHLPKGTNNPAPGDDIFGTRQPSGFEVLQGTDSAMLGAVDTQQYVVGCMQAFVGIRLAARAS